ncbi:hypothetical protein [Photobacterium galatheae]|uniref:Thioredoxin-like fold domain-containing protein n=1 Tax=Photobacterium galatheae TaxID=1654360 RepID=A0A066RPF2_9GAMM|nr:hypothetical protein [Photobacterium galatheae]KDM91001.1 hypothetical protein EA58_14720 [Photobacterium galatheae]MCM0149045.1 hypothetical protein [Photobacterium galatheae]
MNKKISLLCVGLACLGALIGADQYNRYQTRIEAGKPFIPIEGKHYQVISKSEEVNALLTKLGVKEGETFEIMSYTCPACKSMEPMLDFFEAKGVPIQKFQIGMDTLPLAEAEYFVKEKSASNLNAFRKEMFIKMLSSAPAHEKITFAKQIPLEYGLSLDDLAAFDVKATTYKQLTLALADKLQVTHTPTIYVAGQYELIQKNHDSFEQFSKTFEHALNLGKPASVPEAEQK